MLCCVRVDEVSLSADMVVHKNKHLLGYSISIPQVHATFVHFVNKCCMQFFVHRIQKSVMFTGIIHCVGGGSRRKWLFLRVDGTCCRGHDRDFL